MTTSQFYKSGQLTPDEFVQSGYQLVTKCSSWRWGSGDNETNKSYLPSDKQYLYTKGIPCIVRAKSVMGGIDDNGNHKNEIDVGDGWTLTTQNNDTATTTATTTTQQQQSPSETDNNNENTPATATTTNDDDDCPDLDDFDYDNLGASASTAPAPAASTTTTTTSSSSSSQANNKLGQLNDDTDIRTYDISICYDKYYRTPRMYLSGYTSTGQPLNETQIQQDISTDHMNKTATIEQHPYTGLPCISIHPCQHAHTMKRMLEIMLAEEEVLLEQEQKRQEAIAADGKDSKNVLGALNSTNTNNTNNNNNDTTTKEQEAMLNPTSLVGYTPQQRHELASARIEAKMTVDLSLFLFLKFIATVIPTINYDYTISIDIF